MTGRTVLRHPGYRNFWAAHLISLAGSQVSELAVPLTAVLTLHAGPLQMGLLETAFYAPLLLLGLLMGTWVDRRRRGSILVAANLARALLLAWVPAAAWLGLLRIEQLYLVAFLYGALNFLFEIAAQALLPALVAPDQLVSANSGLELADAATTVVGPGLGGVLVQVLSAPVALLVDAATFLVSAPLLAAVRVDEAVPAEPGGNLLETIRQGAAVVLDSPLLRATAFSAGTFSLFYGAQLAVYVLFAVRELRLTPVQLGAVYALAAAGPILASLVAGTVVSRLGFGPATVVAAGASAFNLLVPLASGPTILRLAFLVAAGAGLGFGAVLFNINRASLRQGLTPPGLRGRVGATMRVLEWGPLPLGTLLGGALGAGLGLRPALWLAAAGGLLCIPWIVASPVARLRRLPAWGG